MGVGKHRGNRKTKNILCRAGQDIEALTEVKGSRGCKDKTVQGITKNRANTGQKGSGRKEIAKLSPQF